jgi:hypothetical protein
MPFKSLTQEVPHLESPTQKVQHLESLTQEVQHLESLTQEVQQLESPTQKVPHLKRKFDEQEEEQRLFKTHNHDSMRKPLVMNLFTELKNVLLGMLSFNLQFGVHMDICSLGDTIFKTHSQANEKENVGLKDIWDSYLSEIKQSQSDKQDPTEQLKYAICQLQLDINKDICKLYE